MTQIEIKENIRKLLADEIWVREELIKDDNTLGNDMGMDSFDVVTLVVQIEGKFNIEFPVSTVEEVKKLTLQEVVRFVEKEVNNL